MARIDESRERFPTAPRHALRPHRGGASRRRSTRGDPRWSAPARRRPATWPTSRRPAPIRRSAGRGRSGTHRRRAPGADSIRPPRTQLGIAIEVECGRGIDRAIHLDERLQRSGDGVQGGAVAMHLVGGQTSCPRDLVEQTGESGRNRSRSRGRRRRSAVGVVWRVIVAARGIRRYRWHGFVVSIIIGRMHDVPSREELSIVARRFRLANQGSRCFIYFVETDLCANRERKRCASKNKPSVAMTNKTGQSPLGRSVAVVRARIRKRARSSRAL